MRFRTTILQGDKTATGIRVPAEVVEALGKGKRPPVKVTINGFAYRNTVAVHGRDFMVGVSAENRAGAGVAGGDEVDVDIELDTEPRVVSLPADFAAALDAEPDARRRSRPCPQQQGLARAQVEGAKTDETRAAPDREADRGAARGPRPLTRPIRPARPRRRARPRRATPAPRRRRPIATRPITRLTPSSR